MAQHAVLRRRRRELVPAELARLGHVHDMLRDVVDLEGPSWGGHRALGSGIRRLLYGI